MPGTQQGSFVSADTLAAEADFSGELQQWHVIGSHGVTVRRKEGRKEGRGGVTGKRGRARIIRGTAFPYNNASTSDVVQQLQEAIHQEFGLSTAHLFPAEIVFSVRACCSPLTGPALQVLAGTPHMARSCNFVFMSGLVQKLLQ